MAYLQHHSPTPHAMKAASTPFAVAGLLLLLLLRVHGRSFLQVAFDPLERIAHHGKPPKSSVMDTSPWEEEEEELTLDNYHSPVLADLEQEGSPESDRITLLPGQPGRVDFDQYAGYVTVDRKAGRALFYYFAEAPGSSSASSTPLVLWLNGGPGCSSFGNGAMLELGPFRVEEDGKSLRRNVYSWNSAANVLFLESPAGVGFSYSNTTTDYTLSGDRRTAQDNYAFLVNWLERFPQYKARDLYIAGESYAGHYIPQLAHKILQNNKLGNHTVINLRGIAMGNAYVEDETGDRGMMDFLWMRDLISDEVHRGITSNCNYSASEQSEACSSYVAKAYRSIYGINIYNIYAPLCSPDSPHSSPEDQGFDPCSDDYVRAYLNNPWVQKALHAKATSWSSCSVGITAHWRDSPSTMLPTIQPLMASGLHIWFYSGDIDARVPITATKYFIEKVKPLEETTPWYPWHSHGEVGGFAVAYKEGLALVTVRGAGHLVPSYQPARALTMFTSFLEGKLPPAS